MLRVLCCILLTFSLARADVEVWIQQLGSDELALRNEAQSKLARLGEEKPRSTLVNLAEAYQQEQDLEIQARLEVLLTDLAREWMFYVPPGFLGINFKLMNLSGGEKAILVQQVLPGGAAEEAGLKERDLILQMEQFDLSDLENDGAFVEFVSTLRPGFEAELHLRRDGIDQRLSIKIGQRSIEQMSEAFFAMEERRLTNWLRGLREGENKDPSRPVGHFHLSGEESISDRR